MFCNSSLFQFHPDDFSLHKSFIALNDPTFTVMIKLFYVTTKFSTQNLLHRAYIKKLISALKKSKDPGSVSVPTAIILY